MAWIRSWAIRNRPAESTVIRLSDNGCAWPALERNSRIDLSLVRLFRFAVDSRKEMLNIIFRNDSACATARSHLAGLANWWTNWGQGKKFVQRILVRLRGDRDDLPLVASACRAVGAGTLVPACPAGSLYWGLGLAEGRYAQLVLQGSGLRAVPPGDLSDR